VSAIDQQVCHELGFRKRRREEKERAMTKSILTLPVSLEQVATVIKQMSPAEREKLCALVPELRQAAAQTSPRTRDEAWANVERVQAEVLREFRTQPLLPTEPFLDGLTLEQYLALPDEERARIWDKWAGTDWERLKERDVQPDALPPR
jgi:hypothetical protein